MMTMLYAQVIVKKKTQVEQLTYALPAQIIPYVRVGSIVNVPLRNKNVKAVVVKFVRHVPSELKEKIRAAISVDKKLSVLSAQQIIVIETLAAETGSTVAEIAFHALIDTKPNVLRSATIPTAKGKTTVFQGTVNWRFEQYRKLIKKYGSKRNFVFIFAKKQFAEFFRDSLSGHEGVQVLVSTLKDIFSPLNPGDFLVVDQPYHIGAKYSQRPYLSARQIVSVRGKVERLNIIISDTLLPIEDYPKVKNEFWRMLSQPKTSGTLFVVDRRGSRELIMPSLRQKIEKLVLNKRRGLVLVMSRGWAQALVCGSCGEIFSCDNCSRTISVHAGSLRCHYCGYTQSWPTKCPKCQSVDLCQVGEGVSQFVHILTKLFPETSIATLSVDTPVLDTKAQITVATEKVFSFPDLHFDESYILSADRPLSGAKLGGVGELLSQVLEMKAICGVVSVQTYFPDHPLWGLAASEKYAQYYSLGLNSRRLLRLPPFGSMIKFVGMNRKTKELLDEASAIGSELSKAIPGVEVSFAEITDRTDQNYEAEFTALLGANITPKTLQLIRRLLPPSWAMDLS